MIQREPAKNTVNMVGDGDDVEIVQDIEETFGIQIANKEAEEMRTVGELYDLVRSKIGLESATACLSARAFRILRDASSTMQKSVHPSTLIAEVRGDLSERDWCRRMSERTGLDLELTQWPMPIGLAFIALIICPPILAWVWWAEEGRASLLWLFLWLMLPIFHFTPSLLPQQVETVADIVRWSMGRNFTRLKASGEYGNRADIWLTVCGITRDHTGHTGPIDRETTFFAEHA